MNVEKLNNKVERHDLAFVILRTIPGQESTPEGAQEMGQYLAQGFNPFAVTFWMEAPKTAPLVGKPQMATMCEKIWMKRTMLVDAETLPENPNIS